MYFPFLYLQHMFASAELYGFKGRAYDELVTSEEDVRQLLAMVCSLKSTQKASKKSYGEDTIANFVKGRINQDCRLNTKSKKGALTKLSLKDENLTTSDSLEDIIVTLSKKYAIFSSPIAILEAMVSKYEVVSSNNSKKNFNPAYLLDFQMSIRDSYNRKKNIKKSCFFKLGGENNNKLSWDSESAAETFATLAKEMVNEYQTKYKCNVSSGQCNPLKLQLPRYFAVGTLNSKDCLHIDKFLNFGNVKYVLKSLQTKINSGPQNLRPKIRYLLPEQKIITVRSDSWELFKSNVYDFIGSVAIYEKVESVENMTPESFILNAKNETKQQSV